MSKLVLGLDLGPNSIGWALVNDDPDNPAESRLVDLGVRVFPEGVDNFDTGKEISRNENRRVARGMRRQIRRRARRRQKLKETLVAANLWPSDPQEEMCHYRLDPYELRARALRERLEPFEIGRVLLHLNQRRGFQSNRKKDRGDKEIQGMLAEINELAGSIIASNSRSIGEHFAKIRAEKPLERIRNQHTHRTMYEDEFELIWDTQAKHHPKLLTTALKYGKLGKQKYPAKPIPRHDERRRGLSPLEAFGIYGTIFFQRPMYWPKSVVGLCELEPKQKRCQRADRHTQRFRLLQEVNNLRYTDPDVREERALTDAQRTMLLDYLATRDKATFEQIKKKLGFLESVKFNLERGHRPNIKGMAVDHMMAKTVNDWHGRREDEKDSIVRMLLDNERDDDLVINRLVGEFRFSPKGAQAALEVDFPAGYSNLSLKAIERLLPHLERGLVYQSVSDPEKSALHAAGYLRRDELRRRLFDKLPDPCRVRAGELRIGEIPNPVVKRALVELRKLVNAIIREYGKPQAVHLEMTRTMQVGREKRSQISSQMREREAKRDEAAEAVRTMKVKITRDAILRYLIWQEHAHECVYCGKPISQKQLFSGEADLAHILPYSRCLDDSQMNKIVCHRKCSHGKGNRTPYEWLADSDPDTYDRVCAQVGSLLKRGLMPYKKYRRFLQKELDLDSFIARQLTDTGYIVRATGEYLRCLFDRDHSVLGLKGQLTAELRWQWGLDTILEELPDSPAWRENDHKLRAGEKNRADHRHHAIDAVVIALTNRSRLHNLSKLIKRGGAKAHGEVSKEPWDNFRDDVVEAIKKVNVSHRVERKVAGKLHEDTLYGPTSTPGEWVVRKSVVSLSPNEIERIRDGRVREIIVAKLNEDGIEFGRGKQSDAKKMNAALSKLEMPSGVPINKVRITKPELTIQPLREGRPDRAFVKPGSTHHLCIFEWTENGTIKRDAVYVSMLTAMNRLKEQRQVLSKLVREWRRDEWSIGHVKERTKHAMRDIALKYPIIQRDAAKLDDGDRARIPATARFVMSLSNGELCLLKNGDQSLLVKMRTSKSTENRIKFALVEDARREYHPINVTINTLFTKWHARKVTIDPLGRIRWAND
jgi:CRISPR-associated endonuclease Csn1